MVVAVSIALALQVTIKVGSEQSDSARKAEAEIRRVQIEERQRDRARRPPRRIPLTPELERTAFLDAGARTLLVRAREARMRQDSSLRSYDATSYQRISAGLGFRAFGRERLLFRHESAARVRWSRDGGAWIDVKGSRSVAPAFDEEGEFDTDTDDFASLPYFPGREALWIGSNMARSEVDDRELVHPIAGGSEAYYQFATGDSLVFTLPDQRQIRLRELRVLPRRPEWRLSVGSFWFDDSTGQLVRAVYRLAVPIDIWTVAKEEARREAMDSLASEMREMDDEVPWWVKGLLNPLTANLEAVTIEYGLYGARYWLPRRQSAEGWARAGMMRVPFKMEESFRYASVNGDEELPPLPPSAQSVRDSLFPNDSTLWSALPREERRRRSRLIAEANRERARHLEAARRRECEETGSHTTTQTRYEGTVRMAIRVPCDTALLVNSPDLPPSIYDPGEAIFGSAERDELLKALDFSLQAAWAPQPIRWRYGLGLTRYNRVEGLSSAFGANLELGKGFAVDGLVRLGTGDWEPNVDLGLSRSNGRDTWRAGAYRRLAVMSDWGPEPSFGGLGALLFGRDDGFYYRTTGAELERSAARGGGLSVRLFAEHDHPVSATTSFNVANAFGSASEFGPNIDAERGNTFGLAIRDARSFGLDPAGWRALTNVLVEGGWFAADTGEGRGFSRAAADLTVSRGLGGRVAAALTVAGGLADNAPVQRFFFLGGTPTVRGQLAGTAVGEAYWLARLELGGARGAVRPAIFGDIGWAGPRDLWNHPGRPLSGAGVGLSFLDGLIRADLARGIYPREKFRFDAYFEARF